jgi:SAM-dependent methyltransferase
VDEHALSFGPAAELYDTIRPSYPAEAVAWALAPLGPGHWRVADLGAGTGIMTRLLLAAGYEVVPVEPDALMRSRLEEVTAGVTALAGTAEAIPADDAGVDGAVAAQAYHWFDRPRAHAELVRAIRPGGVFAAIWNHRDESVPWAAEYSRIVGGQSVGGAGMVAEDPDHIDHDHAVDSYGPGFGPVERAVFPHSTRHTPESLVRLMQSRSYYLTASAARQRELVQAILGLTRTHPDLAGRPEFDLPYQTLVFRAVRAGA